MAFAPGSRVGPYEVTAQIGVGGMGEVYRATDTNLKRAVAIKVLPAQVAGDAERLARFQREAEVLASLNHPNIAAIYGLERSGATTALVMELVEGPTLADRIAQGSIPLDEALPIAKQIAEALEAAHEQGIIHRDLKPANIKVRPDGTVKVLDFGLAKALEPAEAFPYVQPGVGAGFRRPDTMAPTITSPAMTRMGMILGTAAYMSPEQARGKILDKRTDVWAFGCVLYEMLAGRRAFGGDDVPDTLANVLKAEPAWTALPGTTPPAIRRLLRRSLEKDRKRRVADIADARLEIDEAMLGSGSDTQVAATSIRSPRRERLAWALTAAAGFAAATTLVWPPRSVPPPLEMRVEISTPATTEPSSIAISPDGRTIAFVATEAGQPKLWLRSLDTLSARPLTGTEGAFAPFWAPNGRSLGFFADDATLKRIDLDGGLVRTLATARLPRGGAWNADDTILFVPSTGPVFRLPAAGGEPVAVTRIAPQQANHFFPQFLPDGNHFVYYVGGSPEVRGVYLAGLDGTGERRLVEADTIGASISKGHLLFVRGATLFAQQLDPSELELTGSPFPVAEAIGVQQVLGALRGFVSASDAGHIVYRIGLTSQERQFIWFDRDGRELGRVGNADAVFSLSPDMLAGGRRLAVHRGVDGNVDIWLLDTDRGGTSRFTTHAANEIHPLWSPDGSRVVFGTNRSGAYELYEKATLGTAEEQLLLPNAARPSDWSRDGRFLLFERPGVKDQTDIWVLPFGTDPMPFPLVQTEFGESEAQFSPDGKWVSYASVESGRSEVYVTPFPGPGLRSSISINGGAQPRWRSDGKELFFIALDGRLMAVPISRPADGGSVEAGTPVQLFSTRVGGAVQPGSRQQYFVSPDGSRFLMNTILEGPPTPPITLIVNWQPRPRQQE